MLVKLPIHMVEKPWGRTDLPTPFVAPPGHRIGEIWFTPPPELDQLLIKYIFTSEKLSVQVHPSNAQSERAGAGSQGKEECWLILAAEPGARIAIGFDREYDKATLRSAALDGRIEHMLRWHSVDPGDFFYIPANTVHAIGAGISLIEVQQNSDVTYRLYDYGRPRELHLDAALAVAKRTPYDFARYARRGISGEVMLADGPHFRLARLVGPRAGGFARAFSNGPLYILPIGARVEGPGGYIEPGSCALVGHIEDICIAPGCLVLAAQPSGKTMHVATPPLAMEEIAG